LIPKFKQRIFHYDDNVKLFLEKALDSIDYLKNVSIECKHEILYKLKKYNYEKGGFIIQMGDIATKMMIIQNGVVEIEHVAEGEPFVIEKLTRGCVINHRSFILADDNDTNAKCGTTVTLYAIDFDDFNAIRQNHEDLDSEVIKIEQYLLNLPNQIALDYILRHPKEKRLPRPW
jgi:CRP-like cAMP-binding protein